jgi:hypothetical protein
VNRWLRRLSLLALTVLALGVLASGSALAGCAPLDAVCLADEALGGVGDAVDDLPLPGDDPVDDVVDPIDDVLPPVVGDTIDRVRRFLDDPSVDPPIDGGGGASHGGGGGNDGGGTAVLGERGDGPLRRPGAVVAGPGSSRLEISSRSFALPGPPAPAQRDATAAGALGNAIAVAARSLALVLGLLGLAAAFVLIQHRLDREDPRLALAPIESDVVTFA